jgi:hypothetical protein
MEKDYLVLKRASASRSSGQWSEDDYDVLADGAVVGRIFKANAAPPEIARRHTATRQRVRPRWRHSRRVGGGSKEKPRTCRGFKVTIRRNPRGT